MEEQQQWWSGDTHFTCGGGGGGSKYYKVASNNSQSRGRSRREFSHLLAWFPYEFLPREYSIMQHLGLGIHHSGTRRHSRSADHDEWNSRARRRKWIWLWYTFWEATQNVYYVPVNKCIHTVSEELKNCTWELYSPQGTRHLASWTRHAPAVSPNSPFQRRFFRHNLRVCRQAVQGS